MFALMMARSYASAARALVGARMCWNVHPPTLPYVLLLTGAYTQRAIKR
jgi:hypothetical protein